MFLQRAVVGDARAVEGQGLGQRDDAALDLQGGAAGTVVPAALVPRALAFWMFNAPAPTVVGPV